MDRPGEGLDDPVELLRARLRRAGYVDLDQADAIRRESDPGIGLVAEDRRTGPQERDADLDRFVRRSQEGVRSRLALAVVLSVPLTVLLVFLSLMVVAIVDGVSVDDIKDVVAVTLTPLVGLAGAVIGFYFGSQRPGGSG